MTVVYAVTGDFNGLAVAIFAVVLAITLLITRWAAKQTRSAEEFYAAGRGITGTRTGSPSRATISRRRRSWATRV